MSRGTGTFKLADATLNIVTTLRRLSTNVPFPVDPTKFYEGCIPSPNEMGWFAGRDTRATNLRLLTPRGRLVQFTLMEPDDYAIAVGSDVSTYYNDVFWLLLPEEVPAWSADTCNAFNIPKNHKMLPEVMAWWHRMKKVNEFINLTDDRLDDLCENVNSLRELVIAFPELAPFCRLKLSTMPVAKGRCELLVRHKQAIWPDPEAVDLIEQLTAASLLPEIDDDDLVCGIDWR